MECRETAFFVEQMGRKSRGGNKGKTILIARPEKRSVGKIQSQESWKH